MKRKDFHLHRTEKYLGMACMFLSGALIFYIAAFAWVEMNSPEDPLAQALSEQEPVVLGSKDVNNNAFLQKEVSESDSMEGEYFLISESLNQEGRLIFPKNYFGEKVEVIYFEVGLQEAQGGERVTLQVHYLEDGQGEAEIPILNKETHTLLEEPAVKFELYRPGASWQLKGLFRAVAKVYSSRGELLREEEQVFEIY
jgi:hypothetical protein